MHINKINFLSGKISKKTSVNFIFDKKVISFLNDLSVSILKSKKISNPEIVTFAFWCRLSNMQRLSKNYSNSKIKIGKGKILHISYSLAAESAF